MATAQDAIIDMQTQALDAIKTSQDAAAETFQVWSKTLAKVAPAPQPINGLSSFVAETLGDPIAIVDSAYDFAGQLVTLNKQFVRRLAEAVEPAPHKQTKNVTVK